MPEKKKLQDKFADAGVYFPVGLYLLGKQEIPKITEKGRSFVSNQLTMAKTIGEFAVTFGSGEAEKRLLAQVRKLGIRWGDHPKTASGSSQESKLSVNDLSSDGAGTNSSGESPSFVENGKHVVSGNGKQISKASAQELAIPGYDSLSASQVVQRLEGLSKNDLTALIEYEKATRARSTILNKAIALSSN